jgi:hypothetical protein
MVVAPRTAAGQANGREASIREILMTPTTATSSGTPSTATMGVRELIHELVQLQDRTDEVRLRERSRRGPADLLRNELVALTHRERQVIAAHAATEGSR